MSGGWRATALPIALAAGAAGAAAAQQSVPSEAPPPEIAAAVASRTPLLKTTAWALDIDRDGATDRLVELVRGYEGGNGWYFEYAIFYRTGESWTEVPLDIPHSGIESVTLVPPGAELTSTSYLDGDPRCCPTGRAVTLLRF